jgi:fatty acid desaturase
VIISGIATAMSFALAHDAAHGSLAASRFMNRLLATLCFLPSWYPYTPWIRGHNHLHHGWTNVAECDYSWRPVIARRLSGDASMAPRGRARLSIVVGAVAPLDRRDLVEAHGDASRERSALSPRRLSRG